MYALKIAHKNSYVKRIQLLLDLNYIEHFQLFFTEDSNVIEAKYRSKKKALEMQTKLKNDSTIPLEVVDLRKQ